MADDFTPIDEFDQDAKFPHKSSRKIGQEIDFIGIKTLTAGSGISIDFTDLENPVISFSGNVLDGLSTFIQSLMVAETQADFRSAIGVTEFGNSLITAVNLAAAFSALEATETGIALLQAANQDAVFDVLGGTAVGKAILQAVDEAAARSAIGVLSAAEVAAAISDALAAITFPDAPVTSVAGKTGDVTLDKGDVGLDAVDNTADADKPVSDAQANADSDVLAAAKAYTDLLALLVTGQIAFNQNKYLNSWTTETSAADNSWQSVAWSDSLLMTAAVASDGTNRVMVSTDGGGSWTSYLVSGTTVALNAICAGPGKFVAVGSGGYVTSDNGSTWIGSNTSGFSYAMNAVTYSAAVGLYVAVGNSGKIYTSTNGTTWTSRISGITTNLNSVVYSTTLNRFVAGGDSEVVYSTDGLTWYQANSGLPGQWKSVVWAGELEVPKYFAIGSSGKCMVSIDGTTWASVSLPSPLSNHNWTSIAWSGTTLVIVGTDGASGAIATSVDGVTWVNRSSAPDVYRIQYKDVVWNSTVGKFFATGIGRSSGGINYDVMSSVNGGTWTNTSIVPIGGNNSHSWTCIEFNGLNGVICTNDNRFASTTDGGVTWTRSTVNLGYPVIDVVWSAGLSIWLVAFANTNANYAVKTSADLITWTAQDIGTGATLPLYSAEWNSTDGLFLLTADNSIYTSPDGSTWTKRTITSPSSIAWQAVVYSASLDLYVAVGTDEVAVSSDGTSWTRLAPPSIPNMKSIARSATKFVSVGSGNAAVSVDGIEWTSVPVPAANTWESVAWSAPLGVFVAVASSGTTTNRVMSSPDGITWTLRISASGNNWKDVTWLNSYDRFVAVAASGTGTRVMMTG